MAAKLDQFLEPGEQVAWRLPKCREPHNLYRDLSFTVIIFALAFGTGLIDIDPDRNMVLIVTFLVMLPIHLARAFLEIRSIEAAVTERRVLRVDTNTNKPKCTSIDLADIASVEVLLRAVHVTKRNGDGVLLELPEQASKLGRALARAASVAKPRLPGHSVEFADNFSAFAAALGFCAGVVFTVQVLAAAVELVSIPLLLYLVGIVLLFYISILGWYAGELLALVILRPHLSPEDFRTFFRSNFTRTSPATRLRKPSWLAVLYWRLVQFASGIPADPSDQGQTDPNG